MEPKIISKQEVLSNFESEIRTLVGETGHRIREDVLERLHGIGSSIIEHKNLMPELKYNDLIKRAAQISGYSDRTIMKAAKLARKLPSLEMIPPELNNKTLSFNKLCMAVLGLDKSKIEKKLKTCPKCGFEF